MLILSESLGRSFSTYEQDVTGATQRYQAILKQLEADRSQIQLKVEQILDYRSGIDRVEAQVEIAEPQLKKILEHKKRAQAELVASKEELDRIKGLKEQAFLRRENIAKELMQINECVAKAFESWGPKKVSRESSVETVSFPEILCRELLHEIIRKIPVAEENS